jgi:hypothetical protein
MRLAMGPRDQAGDRFVMKLATRVPSALVRAAVPGTASVLPVAGDLLTALGKREPVNGYHPNDVELGSIWLAAEGIGDVVIHHGDLYPDPVLTALDACCAAAGARLWVLLDPLTSGGRTWSALAAEHGAPVPWTAFRRAWMHRARASRSEASEVSDGGELPLESVWLAEHRRLSALSERPTTDAYLTGFVLAARWRNDQGVSREVIAERIRELVGRFDDRLCRVRALRGADIAIRPLGWQLRIDIQRMAGGPPAEARPAAGTLRPSALRRERRPDRAACVALAALGLSMPEILRVPIGAVRPDGTGLSLEGEQVDVPTPLRPALRAQRLWRHREGAAEGHPLIRASTAASVPALIRVIMATQSDLEDSAVVDALRHRPGRHERWLLDQGVALEYTAARERGVFRPGGIDPLLFRDAILSSLAGDRPAQDPCACAACHPRPGPEEVPGWPPKRRHVSPGPDHPWRNALHQNRRRFLAAIEERAGEAC